MRTVLVVLSVATCIAAANTHRSSPERLNPQPPFKATSEVLAIAGTRAVYQYVQADSRKVCGKQWYVSEQSLAIRNLTAATVRVLVWARGMPSLSFAGAGKNECCGSIASSEFREILVDPSSTVIMPYQICTVKTSSVKAQGNIFVSANGLAPESIPMTIETPSRWDQGLLTPIITGAVGVIVGAFFTFLSFLGQQMYLQRREREKTYREGVAAHAHELQSFFATDYSDLLGDQHHWTANSLNDFRTKFISSGGYGVLPPREMSNFDQVCRAENNAAQWAGIRKIMERNFGQFIRSNQ
jgi:hypothetical protein